jgi:FkbM family methyltransferase
MVRKQHKIWIHRLAKKMRPVLPYGILANLEQWLIRYSHDEDFEVFEWLTEVDGIVLDVGASRGQSALSVLHQTRKLQVFSVEPNHKHRWSLLLVWLLHPFRFRYRLVAAGDEHSHQTLYVPGRRASGLSAQGSLDPAEFEKEYVRERLAESNFDADDKTGYRRVPVTVIPLDSLALAPDIIKLDVEGFEFQALTGLQRTLTDQRPALLIEINNLQRWLPFLDSLGYIFYYYDQSSKTLKIFDNDHDVLNLFCLHKQSDSGITRILLEHTGP